MRRGFLMAAATAALLAVFGPAAAAKTDAPSGDTTPGSARAITSVDQLEPRVLSELNAVRARHGLGALRLSPQLAAAAERHSRAMGQLGFFSHKSADGSSFSKRIERFYGPAGFRYWSIGENLLWASPEVDAAAAVRMWMKSPHHRDNILRARWREIGLSAVHVTAAPGTFRGLDVTIVTTDFGVRR
jgi:uncharacterized protein YkwD